MPNVGNMDNTIDIPYPQKGDNNLWKISENIARKTT